MNYHNILHDDMRNGTGLRVTLFVSGCEHHCTNCHNSQTWDCKSGIEFDLEAQNEIFEQLEKKYISGITLSGGDPLYPENVHAVLELCKTIKSKYPSKTIWLYTGYTWEELQPWTYYKGISENCMLHNGRSKIINLCNVVVDGKFDKNKADVNYHWAGSTNQRVIDVQKSLKNERVVLWQQI